MPPSVATATAFSTGALARHFGVESWKIRRLFERGLLIPSERVGGHRLVFAADLWKVEKALRAAGYLKGATDPGVEEQHKNNVLASDGGSVQAPTRAPIRLGRQ